MLTGRLLFALFVLLCCAFAAPVPSESDDDDDCALKYCDLFEEVCKNGAKCISTDCKNGICQCQDGFTGHFCENAISKPKTTTMAPRYTKKRKSKRKKKFNSLILRLFKTLAYSRSAPEEKEEKTDPPTTPKTTTTTVRTTPKTTTTTPTTTTPSTTTPTTTTPSTTTPTTTTPSTTTPTTTTPSTTTPTTTTVTTTSTSTFAVTTTTSTSTTALSTTTVVPIKSIKESSTKTNVPTTPYFATTLTSRPSSNMPDEAKVIPAPASEESKVMEHEDALTMQTTISSDRRNDFGGESTPVLFTMYASVKPNIEIDELVSSTPMPNLDVDQDIINPKQFTNAESPVKSTMNHALDIVSNQSDLPMEKDTEKLASGVSGGMIHEQTKGYSSDMKVSKTKSTESLGDGTSDSNKSSLSANKPVSDTDRMTNDSVKDITEEGLKEVLETVPSKLQKSTSIKLKDGDNKLQVPGIVPLKTLQNKPETSTEKVVESIPDIRSSKIELVTSTASTSADVVDVLKKHKVIKEEKHIGQAELIKPRTHLNASKEIIVPGQSLPNKTLNYLKSFTREFVKTVMSNFENPSKNESNDGESLVNETSQDIKSLTNVSDVLDVTTNNTDTSNMTLISPYDLDAGNSSVDGENYVIIDTANITDIKVKGNPYSGASSQPTAAATIQPSSSTTVLSTTPLSKSDTHEKISRGDVSTTRAPRVHIIEPAHLGIKTDNNKNDRMSISARISGFENSLLPDSDAKNTDAGVEKHIHNLYMNFDNNKEMDMNEENHPSETRNNILNTTPDFISNHPDIARSTETLLTSTSAPTTKEAGKTLSENKRDNDGSNLQKLSTVSTALPQEDSNPSKSSLYVDSKNSLS